MAEQPFLVGNKARELLRYTQRATRIVSDDISRSDARKVFQKAAALEDIRERFGAEPENGYLPTEERH